MENQKVEGGKYYTPEIEEFYVGFEYEVLDPDTKEYYKWVISDKNELWEAFDEYPLVRVKYLDQSDIESLGWIHDQYAGDGTHVLNFKHNDWFLNFWHNSSNPLVEIGRDDYDTGFFGHCKNISELKRILKQIEYK